MELHLKNFGLHLDRKFSFPDVGLVLICGENGVGKTTIFDAIIHALFGIIRSPYGPASSECQVILKFKDIKIIRSDGPKSLILFKNKKKFEGDEAQSIISSMFGGQKGISSAEFISSSCITETKSSSILALKPTEQLLFVEKLAFDPTESQTILKKIREKTAQCKLDKENVKGGLNVISAVYKKEKEKFKSKTEPSGGELIDIKETEKTLDSLKRELADLNSNISKLSKSSQRYSVLESQQKAEKIHLEKTRAKLSALEENPSNPSTEDLDKAKRQLKIVSTTLKYTPVFESIQKDVESLSILEKRRQDIQEQIKEIAPIVSELKALSKERDSLLEEKTRCTDIETKLKEQILKKREFIKEITSSLSTVKLIIQIPQKKYPLDELSSLILELIPKLEGMLSIATGLKCPSCSVPLKLENNILSKVEETQVIGNAKDIEGALFCAKKIVDCISNIKNIDDWKAKTYEKDKLKNIQSALDEVSIKLESLKSVETRISEFEGELKACEKQILSVPKVSKQLPPNFKPNPKHTHKIFTILNKRIADIEALKEKHRVWNLECNALKDQIKISERTIIDIEKELKKINVGNVEELLELVQSKTKEIESCNKNIDYTKSAMAFEKARQDLDALKAEKKKSSDEFNVFNSRLEGLFGSLNLYKEAKVISTSQCVQSINNAAKIYLEEFFSESEISVVLSPDKTEKKLNTITTVKGNSTRYHKLSGGQRQAAELAFCLGLADIFGSKLILLDETLNHTSQTLNTKITRFLHDKIAINRLVLVISHEAVHGHFDAIVHVI